MKQLPTLILVVIIGALMLHGCASETSAPTTPMIDKGTLTPVADNFMQTIGDAASTLYYVYTPYGYDAARLQGYPVIYMLNGFGGDENYFVALFSAVDAADWLLARGDIQEMVLVFPSGHTVMGGSFYTNSLHPTVGNSETHIMNIITEVEADYNIDPTKRGIGGHSMGGFGAVSIAMNHPDMFSTLSAIAGPLSFWGTMPASDLYKGIEEVLPTVLAETGYDTILTANPAGDLAAYQQHMYPDPARRITSMMFGMAAAFSPTNPVAPEQTSIAALGVDLPIGIDGQIYMPTWNRWMGYDPVARFAGGQAANLAGVKIYLDAGSADDLGLYGAHDVFAGALAQASMPPSVHTTYQPIYDSQGNEIPADHTTYTYERIKELLKWHSSEF